MGRKPYSHKNLPPRMRKRVRGKKTWFYYDKGGKPRVEIPLGCDFILALQKYADLEITSRSLAHQPRYEDMERQYTAKILPTKKIKTQQGYLESMKRLAVFFKDAPLSQIKPLHIRQYIDKRGKRETSANREIALFSTMFNYAREWGWIDTENPAAGVRKNSEKPRDMYISHEEYFRCWEAADQAIRDAMDLAYYTGQRRGDLLNMQDSDIKDGALWLKQGKTGTRLRIEMTGELAVLIEDIKARKRSYKIYSPYLLVIESGLKLLPDTLRSRFDAARKASGVKFQFRDIRAKAATDKENSHNLTDAQYLLGHTSSNMTRAYVRNRTGKLVEPSQKMFRKEDGKFDKTEG